MTDATGTGHDGGRPPTRRSAADRDPVARARALHEVYDAVLSGARAAAAPRSLVSESWQRSLAARVDPDRHVAPVTYRDTDLDGVRAAHPLGAVLPMLRSTLVSIADEAVHIMVVTDADGTILWREGARSLLRSADAVGLAPGTRWSEEAIGTNAMGTALAVDAPVSIHSAEHLVRAVHAWTCAAAPVHDPDTGTIIGAIDITGPLKSAHPAMVALVAATAQLAENQLRVRLAIADEQLRVRNMPHLTSLGGRPGALITPTGRVLAGEPYGAWPTRVAITPETDRVRLDDGREMLVEPLAEGYLLRAARPSTVHARRRALSLRFLGDSPSVLLDGTPVPVTLRPAELLATLSLHPDGLTAERLALLLYGDDGNPTTARGEVLRLRSLIGADVLRTRPYRLDAEVDTDFGAVRRALTAGRPAEALRACAGLLLPRSDAPEIREERDTLCVGLRRAVLAADEADLLADYAAHPLGRDDLEVHDRLLELMAPHDRRRPALAVHRDRLLATA
jgi:GAF domain-containing protein